MLFTPPIAELGEDSVIRQQTRLALAQTIWTDAGERRLPADAALASALAACEPRDVGWVCETSSPGPVYFLPTREWIAALVELTTRLQVTKVLEVASGDGLVARALQGTAASLEVTATDSGAWARSAIDPPPSAGRATPRLRLGDHVVRLPADEAVARYTPELVIVCWAPSGPLVSKLVAMDVRWVLEVTAEGAFCGHPRLQSLAHERLSGPLEEHALCRFDTAPHRTRQTRVWLYRGALTEQPRR